MIELDNLLIKNGGKTDFELAPVIIFTYNRINHVKKVIDALKNNVLASRTEVFIFSDGFKDNNDKFQVEEVRLYLKKLKLKNNKKKEFKNFEIFESKGNNGCTNSVIYGINKIFDMYKMAIILEDDIITSKNFLMFMNKALQYYKNDFSILNISAYNLCDNIYNRGYDTFLYKRFIGYGWAIWKNRWDLLDWNMDKNKLKNVNIKQFKKISPDLYNNFLGYFLYDFASKLDWDIMLYFNQLILKKFTVLPIKSKTINIGMDGSGLHRNFVNNNKKYNFDINDDKLDFNFCNLVNKDCIDKYSEMFEGNFKNKILRFLGLLARLTNSYSLAHEIRNVFKL